MSARRRAAVRVALAAFVAATAPMTAARARTLDRRGAVRAALATNPRIAAARAEEAAAAAQRRQVDAARMPIVNVTVGIGPSLVATLVPGTAAQSAEAQYHGLALGDLSAVIGGSVSVIQPLYTFGKIATRAEAAMHAQRAREAQTRMQRADVAFEVAQIYEGLLLARDAQRYFDELDHWLESTLGSSQDKLASGAGHVSDRDILRLQAARGVTAMALHQAEAGVAQARAGLAAYLGLPPGEAVETSEDELAPVGLLPADFAALLALAAQHRPELAATREGSAALDALARGEAAARMPDVFVMGFADVALTPGRDWIQSRFVVDPLNHVIPGALLGLRWQFQGGMARARADEQRAHAEALRQLGAWAGAGIPAELRKAYEDVRRADRDLEQGGDAVKKAKQWMVQASADYSVGLLDIREVSDAVSAYVSLRTAIMKARFDHNVGMAALAKAAGTLDRDDDTLYLAHVDNPKEVTR